MSDFKFNIEDLNDTASITRKISDSFYPAGKIYKTSLSQTGDLTRTLTQRDLQAVLGGDAIYRNPTYVTQLNGQMINSTITGILSAIPETDAVNALVIPNPDTEDQSEYLRRSTCISKNYCTKCTW